MWADEQQFQAGAPHVTAAPRPDRPPPSQRSHLPPHLLLPRCSEPPECVTEARPSQLLLRLVPSFQHLSPTPCD